MPQTIETEKARGSLSRCCALPRAGLPDLRSGAGGTPVGVKFDPGASSTAIRDRLKGDQSANYELGAGAGQTMVVSLASGNTGAYFNLYGPGNCGLATPPALAMAG